MSDGITDGMNGMQITGRCKVDWSKYGWMCQWLHGDHDCTAFRHYHCPFTPDARVRKNPVQSRWVVYDSVEHEFSVYYDEQEARKEYDARIKQINDDVGNDEYEGEEEVYLCQVISKAEVVEVGRDDQSEDALYRLIPYDCSAKSDAVLDTLRGTSDTKLEDFLEWIADRMIYVYHEPENIDFVLSLRERAKQARELRSQHKER